MDREGKILPYKSFETYLKERQYFHLESQIDSRVKAEQDALVKNHGYKNHKTIVDPKLAKFFIKHFAFRLVDVFTKQDLGKFACFGNSGCFEMEGPRSNSNVSVFDLHWEDNFKMDRHQIMKYFRQTIKMKTENTFIVNDDHSEILDEPVGKELTLRRSDDDFFLKYFFKYFKGEPFAFDKKLDQEYKYGIRNKVETSVRNQKSLLYSQWIDYSYKYKCQCRIYIKVFKPKLNDIDDEEEEKEWNTILEKMGDAARWVAALEKKRLYIKKIKEQKNKIIKHLKP